MHRLGGIDILGGANRYGLGISTLSLRQIIILKLPYMETRATQHLDTISRLYEETSPMLLAIFLKANIPEEDARDLVQEVFVKILTIDIILPEGLKGLAITIAYQKRTDWLRHQAYCRRMMTQMRPQTIVEQHELECQQMEQVEQRVVNRMSDKDAWVYKLSRFDNKSTQEIIQITSFSLRGVEGRLYRTRLLVRRTLKAAGF